ncbi:STAS domain-containing protein [Terasakiella pusilla]|uniref:STAS domain-containing protein n=1 Tax=Terasakiella pusilla TaxID=64973 RepID=UPI003AA8B0AA
MTEAFEIKVENDKAILALLPILDMSAADSLLDALRSCVSSYSHLVLDASVVERISTPCIQVLLAAAFKVEKNGGRFSMKNVSPTFERGMRDLGLSDYLRKWSEN